MVNGEQTRRVYVYNKTREGFLGTEVSVASTYLRRLVGLIGKTPRWAGAGRGLWIVPCHGVHTIGMLFPIDVIYLDRNNKVIRLDEFVRPFRVSRPSLRAASVLELPPHTIYRSGTREGDCLEIGWLRAGGSVNLSPQHAVDITSHPAAQAAARGCTDDPAEGTVFDKAG